MNHLVLKLQRAAQYGLSRQEGQGLTEYALAFSVIALGTIAGESAVAQHVNRTFIAIASTITSTITQ